MLSPVFLSIQILDQYIPKHSAGMQVSRNIGGPKWKSFFSSPHSSEFLMLSTKHLADVGYRVFSGSMMLLTLYGGYLCTLRGYRYVQRQKQLQLAAQNQSIDPEIVKDWSSVHPGTYRLSHLSLWELTHSSLWIANEIVCKIYTL